MGRRTRSFFTAILLLGLLVSIAGGVFGGRWTVNATLPMWSDASQWHFALYRGTFRFLRGDFDSGLSRQNPGLTITDDGAWSWEWWFHFAPTGSVAMIQIPLWFPALLCLALLVLRVARKHMRLAAGVCPDCGRATGGAARCPKCGRDMQRTMAPAGSR